MSVDAASTDAREAPGLLYGRVTTYGGTVHEGRLRWGGDEEAFWHHYFNGYKDQNPWAVHTPLGAASESRRPILFGIELPTGAPSVDLGRPFMARFGDIARIESRGDGVRGMIEDRTDFDPDVRVILKSGTVFDLDRLAASDFDDGVRVWDRDGEAVDLEPHQIRTVEFLPTPPLPAAPDRLHGTVYTRQGAFTGSIQWNREDALGSDRLEGRAEARPEGVRFDAIRSIARQPDGGSRVTQTDGRTVVLTGTAQVDRGNRGVYVDDPRYGRVLVSWDAFDRIDFTPGSSSPAYADFEPGRPLAGTITTRAGRRLSGRLVFDLDESETTETLDAPAQGVDYTLPFSLVRSIDLPASATPATVTLRSGETLRLDRSGDLGDGNAGLLVFSDGRESPEYVPWPEAAQIEFSMDMATEDE